MLFSMLANLAEDRHSRASQHWPSLASALDILDKQGVARAEVIRLLDNGLIRPVPTAHPTEVRRKSLIDHSARIEDFMTLRDNGTSPQDRKSDVEGMRGHGRGEQGRSSGH